MSGLLAGIMLARPAASFAAHLWGWRSIFVISAGSADCARPGASTCPRRQPDAEIPTGARSPPSSRNYRERRTLQLRGVYQALLFMAFNLFWTVAPLELARSFGFAQEGIALFALAGPAGAAAAPIAGMARRPGA